MPHPRERSGENPSTYVVQDRSSQEEMTRLEIQDKMLTDSMGGVLPELSDPTSLRKVLDVGCGTGGWLMETAKTYPRIEELVGVDISGKMVAYARTRAEKRQLSDRVEFQIMDALGMLEFPDASFDLVNQRSASSWLRTWDWRTVFLEYLRVTRPGGIIRVVESGVPKSNSPALNKLNQLSWEAGYHSGRLFAKREDGVIGELGGVLERHAIQDVQTREYTLTFRAGTQAGQSFCEDMAKWYHVGMPFFQKYINVPSDYQEIYQQALKEMVAADFEAQWTWLTAWGIRPKDGQPIFRRGLL